MGVERDTDLEKALLPKTTAAKAVKVEKPQVSRSRRSSNASCCGCCCKVFLGIFLGLFLLLVITVTAAGIYGYRTVREEVIRFSTTTPKSLPTVEPISWRECKLLEDEAELFFDKIIAGKEPEKDLVVSVDQINGCYIANSDYLNGNAFISVQDDTLTIDMSLPMDPLPGGEDRYFVATEVAKVDGNELSYVLDTPQPIDNVEGPLITALFEAEHDATKWIVHILSGKFLNWEVPQDFIDEKQDLFEDLYDDEDTAAVLEGIEGFSFRAPGVITIHPRRGQIKSNVKSTRHGDRKLWSKLFH